jgi:hypothetical protein
MAGPGQHADLSAVLLFSAHWGSESRSIPLGPVERLPLSSTFITDSRRLVRPVFQLRPDENGEVLFLFEATSRVQPTRAFRLFAGTVDGEVRPRFDIEVDLAGVVDWHILDFVSDRSGGIYVLELLGLADTRMGYRLRRLDQQGREVWSRHGRVNHQRLAFDDFEGKFDYLLANGSSLYLPAVPPQQGIAGIDPASGQTTAVEEWDEPYDRVTLGPRDDVYYARLLVEDSQQRHVLIRRDLRSGGRQVIQPDIRYLLNLAGVDRSGCIYARQPNGIARLGPDGRLQWRQFVYGVVTRAASREVFVCNRCASSGDVVELDVVRCGAGVPQGPVRTFKAPRSAVPDTGEPLRLAGVDADFNWYFYAGESEHNGGTLFEFNDNADLRSVRSLAESGANGDPSFDAVNSRLFPIESETGPPDMFEVDERGNVYIPVSDAEGFKVVRFESTSNS